jgi:hypothetical protein
MRRVPRVARRSLAVERRRLLVLDSRAASRVALRSLLRRFLALEGLLQQRGIVADTLAVGTLLGIPKTRGARDPASQLKAAEAKKARLEEMDPTKRADIEAVCWPSVNITRPKEKLLLPDPTDSAGERGDAKRDPCTQPPRIDRSPSAKGRAKKGTQERIA